MGNHEWQYFKSDEDYTAFLVNKRTSQDGFSRLNHISKVWFFPLTAMYWKKSLKPFISEESETSVSIVAP